MQIASTYLVPNEIPEGSPPTSSSRANTFFVGCSHEREAWYLFEVVILFSIDAIVFFLEQVKIC